MKKIIIISGAFILFSIALKAQEMEKMEVMMRMAGLRSGLLNKDSIALSALLDNEVTYGHTNGLVQTKAQLIRDLVSGIQDYKTIDPAEMKIRVYDNMAIVNMQSKVGMLLNGKPLDLNMNVLLVWVRKNKEWKLVARQSVNRNN